VTEIRQENDNIEPWDDDAARSAVSAFKKAVGLSRLPPHLVIPWVIGTGPEAIAESWTASNFGFAIATAETGPGGGQIFHLAKISQETSFSGTERTVRHNKKLEIL